MNRLKRPFGRVVVVVVCCACALVASATAAVAASDQIPRPPGAIDNRGWELVSTPDKNLAQLGIGALLSTDGTGVMYSVFGGAAGSPAGTRSQLLARRTSSGWTSTSLLPSRDQMPAETYYPVAAAPDLSSWIASAEESIGGSGTSPTSTLLRLDDAGHQALLHTFPVAFGPSGVSLVTSDDLRHAFVDVPYEAADTLDPSHQPDTSNVYDYGSGTPQLVSRMPVTNDAPLCGVDPITGFARNTDASTALHWVSTDGSKVFFASRGDGAGCGDPFQLYRRDVDRGVTTLVTDSVDPRDTDFGINNFIQGAADGSWVIYRTPTSYDPLDDADGSASDQDLYRWTATGGNVCLTCNGTTSANVVIGLNRVAAARDGSRVYFESAAQLTVDAPAATAQAPNLYVWRASDGVHWVTHTDRSGVTALPGAGGYVTPDGNVLIFRSSAAGLDAQSGRSNGGFVQFYRYQDDTGTITCLSCPTGAATGAPPNILASNAQAVRAPIRVTSDDGSIVFFPARDALVPEDTNNNVDLYEWHDGVTKLITSGQGTYGQNVPSFEGTTADGHDVLFYDSVNLTNDPAGDPAIKLYDARVDGGFQPPPTPRAACVEDQCRSLPTTPPTFGDLATELLRGAGNLAPPPAAAFHVASIGRSALTRFARTGRLVLPVRVTDAGAVSASATARLGKRTRTVAHASSTAHGAGTVKLRLTLSAAARSRLARTGKLKVTLVVRYSTTGGSRRLVLNLKAVRHGR